MYLYTSNVSASLALISLVSSMFFPQAVQVNNELIDQEVVSIPADGMATIYGQALIKPNDPSLPRVLYTKDVIVTAYSSTVDQTDDSPFITASGTRVKDGIIACNFLPFGAKVRFPDVYGNKIFVVEDRMALRNSHKIDIWFETRDQAKQFGVKYLRIEVLGI